MLNIRTTVLSAVLVLILMLTAQWVTPRTEVVSNQSRGPSSVSEIQVQSAGLKKLYSAPSYRAQFGECFDVSIKDLATCRAAGQLSAQVDQSPVDECFDVSNISELAGCRNAGQAAVQVQHSAVDECFDVSISELANCRNGS